jgi:hypothetical protein
MGAQNTRLIQVEFRDGMVGQFFNQRVPVTITIQQLSQKRKAKSSQEYSRVGMTGFRKGKQVRNWFWIQDRQQTLEFYINEVNIQEGETVHITFFV